MGPSLPEFSLVSPVGGRGWGQVGRCLPPPTPNTDQRVWSWLGQGKKGERGQASVFNPSGYEPFTLVSNLW